MPPASFQQATRVNGHSWSWQPLISIKVSMLVHTVTMCGLASANSGNPLMSTNFSALGTSHMPACLEITQS